MKIRSIKLLGILWVAVTMLLFSCSKFKSYENPANNGNPYGSNANFEALISGIQWTAAPSSDTAYTQNGTISLYGVNNLNQSLSINLNGTTTGIYQLNSTTVSIGVYVDGNSGNPNPFSTDQSLDTSQAGGEVTVSEIDTVNNTISGSFQLNVFRSADGLQKTLSQGQFSKIPYIASTAEPGNADTMYAQIDSANWVALNIIADASSGQYIITGSTQNGTVSVSLTMPNNITPGSYTLAFSSGTYIGQYTPNDSTILESQGNGSTLQILQNNSVTGRVQGNFNFLAQPLTGMASPAQLSNGYFSVIVQ
jgi:hypothetical protein